MGSRRPVSRAGRTSEDFLPAGCPSSISRFWVTDSRPSLPPSGAARRAAGRPGALWLAAEAAAAPPGGKVKPRHPLRFSGRFRTLRGRSGASAGTRR